MKKFLCLFQALLLLWSCEGTFDDPESGAGGFITTEHGMIVLGERLEDPYSVDNVTKAVETLYPTKAGRVRIDPTDYYVRFLPRDRSQYDELVSLGLDLLDHPMDYRIVRDGDYYVDPEVGEESITWQYTVVRSGFDFPEDIRYEILDECYIAEHSSTKASDVDWDAVERESYLLTGNADFLSAESRAGTETAAPKGRIAIVDEAYDTEPVGVAGVKVTCNSFVKIASAFTDEEGYYEIPKSYSTDIRYRIVFKNQKGFAIGFNLVLVPASVSTLGKNSPKGVSVVIDSKSDRKLFDRCAVNNAAFDYYERCKSGAGMSPPPSDLRIWLFHRLSRSSTVMMQQGAVIDKSLVADYLGEYSSILKMFLPDVTLGLKDKEFDYQAIYSQTLHQLAHSGHFSLCGKDWWDNYVKFLLTSFVTSGWVAYGVGTEDGAGYAEIAEMWAFYVQTLLTRERYGDSVSPYGTSFWFHPQIFLTLNDRGLDCCKLSLALTPDVADRSVLQERLLALYPEYKSIINQTFLRYL